jgi:hypothetical protein
MATPSIAALDNASASVLPGVGLLGLLMFIDHLAYVI